MTAFDAHYGPELGVALADAEQGRQAIRAFSERAIQEESDRSELGSEFSQYFSALVRQASETASNVIYRHARSPIERIFLGTLVLSFLRSDPTAFLFTPPCSDAPVSILAAKEDHQRVLNWVRAFDSDKRRPQDWTLPMWLSQLEREAGEPIPNRARLEAEAVLTQLGYFKSFHFTPQAAFPDLRIDARSCRVDLLVWLPGSKGHGLVVECDGYEFHRTKTSFIRDRKRDRRFLELGYTVVRYSGTEIVNHPVETSYDLYELLLKRKRSL